MIITCEACNTSFNLDEKMLSPKGSKVRCSVCSKVFTAFPGPVPPPEPVGPVEKTDSDSPVSEPSKEVARETVDQTGIVPDAEEIDPELSFDEAFEIEGLDDESEQVGDEVQGEEQNVLEEELDAELDLLLDSESPDDTDATMIADLEDDEFDFSLDIESDESDVNLSTLDESDFDLDIPLVSQDDPEGTETILADLDDDPLEIEDDLDLSNLEKMLEEEKDTAETTESDDGGENGAQLSLDLDDELQLDGEIEQGEMDEGASGFDLDFESDNAVGSDDQEIDLSEIEKMLEEPGGDFAEAVTVPEQDLDLDAESGLDAEKWMTKTGENEKLIQDEEIDLTELEQVISDVDLDAEPQPVEEPELALDIQDSVEEAATGEAAAEDSNLELDLSDFEDDLQFVDDKLDGEADSDDMELKFELEPEGYEEQTLEDSPLEENAPEMIPQAETTVSPPPPPEPAEESEVPPFAAAQTKKGTNKFLVFLLIVILLGGGGYGVYYLVAQQGLDIPFLSDYLNPAVDDPGNLKLSTYEINSKFIDNANVGKLFVISGKIKNGYPENRGMITLQGKLFSEGKVPVNQEKVYCGNVMSDLELSNLEWDKIKARLSNRLGDNRSNVKIEPGASIPFMVVFSGLPDDLEEFTIEVTGSTVLK